MELDCCDSIFAAALLVTNLVFLLCGLALMGGGIYMQVEMSDYLDFLGDQAVSTAIVMIVLGALLALITFLGCCGACTRNKCMMQTYGAILLLLLIAEIGTAVAIYVYRGDVQDLAHKGMTDTQKNYLNADQPASKTSWDALQRDFECCGVDDYKKWSTVVEPQKSNWVPDSCCKEEKENCGQDYREANIYTDGCLSKFVDSIESEAGVAAGIGIGIGVFQLITVILACVLGKKMGDNEFA